MTTGCHGDNLLLTSLTIHPTSVMTELFAWMLNQPLSRCFQTLWSLTTSVIIRCSFFSVYAMILRTVCFWTLAPRLVLLSCLQVVCLAFDSLLCLPFFFFLIGMQLTQNAVFISGVSKVNPLNLRSASLWRPLLAKLKDP